MKLDDAPFCFYCGYSLTGLDLPRPCPECGQTADPQRQLDEARTWFASWRAWFGAVRRPSRLPAGLLYALDDNRLRKIARRRVFIALVLPALLTSMVVLAGASFAIHKTGRSYYVNPKDPARTPLRVEPLLNDERPFNFYLHMRLNLFRSSPPPTWEYVEEVTSSKATFSPPPELDSLAVTAGFAPFLVLIFGYGSSVLLLEFIVKRLRVIRGRQRLQSSLRVMASVPVILVGIGSWLWLLGIVYLLVVGSGDVQRFNDDDIPNALLSGSVMIWLLSGIIGPLIYVRFDRCGRLYVPRYLFYIPSMVLSVGGPLLAWSLLMRLLW